MAECSGGEGKDLPENSVESGDLVSETIKILPEMTRESEEELYEVEKIVGTTKINGRLLYKVRWRGYSANWDTFEPVENLQTCLDLITEFQSKKDEVKKKRAVERQKKKALMEGRLPPTPDNSVSSVETTIPTRTITDSSDTLKDTFWRDLEQGKVNLFETDMYSKVKGQGRASRPTSFKPSRKDEAADSSSDTNESSKVSRKRNVSRRKLAGKRQKIKVKKKCKGKTETAFDRAQLDCHNVINTPESLCNSSSNSNSRSSLFYTDLGSGQKVKSPVSLNSELLVKVERIHMSEYESYNTESVSKSSSVTNLESSESNSSSDHYSNQDGNSNSQQQEEVEINKSPPSTEDNVAAMKSIPKRSIADNESEGGKKLRTSFPDTPVGYASTSASPEKGADQNYPQPSVKIPHSAIDIISPQLTPPEEGQSSVSVTELSIKRSNSYTSPSYIDISDLPCIQTSVNEGSDLESSCRGDKFSETSPPTDSGEESTKGEEEPKTYAVGLLGTAMLDDIDPLGYDAQAAEGSSDCEDSSEISERKFQDLVSEGNYERVKKALESAKSYNLDGIDATGLTLLMYAAKRGYDDIIELLVKHGARINAQQINGTTALMLACEHSDLCTVVLIVDLGANLNLQRTSGETALMKAVKRGSKQIVRFLLERGANFASQTIMGNSAMTYAKMLHVCDVEDILFDHVARLTAEFDRQVSTTINNTAKILCALFPLQCFPLCDGNKFVIHFKHELQHITPGVGYLLFIAHTRITPQEIKCRFYGPCAVTGVTLNGVAQPSLTEVGIKADANFVLSCCPLNNGKNELIINTTPSPSSRSQLVVCAYKAKMLE